MSRCRVEGENQLTQSPHSQRDWLSLPVNQLEVYSKYSLKDQRIAHDSRDH
jgi:hypothetical protein